MDSELVLGGVGYGETPPSLDIYEQHRGVEGMRNLSVLTTLLRITHKHFTHIESNSSQWVQ